MAHNKPTTTENKIDSHLENATARVKLWSLFLVFAKIGGLTFGGGLAMIPVVERELVENHHWLDSEQFAEMITIVNAAPGTFAINIAAYTGYTLRGFGGAAVAAIANIIIPFWLIILITGIILSDNYFFNRFLSAMRPAVVALIFAAGFRLGKTAYKRAYDWLLGVVTLVLVLALDINPIYLIIGGAIAGIVYELARPKGVKGGAAGGDEDGVKAASDDDRLNCAHEAVVGEAASSSAATTDSVTPDITLEKGVDE